MVVKWPQNPNFVFFALLGGLGWGQSQSMWPVLHSRRGTRLDGTGKYADLVVEDNSPQGLLGKLCEVPVKHVLVFVDKPLETLDIF